MSSNAHGNDNRGIRRFLRENGYKPTVDMVERVSREVRQTESQRDNAVKIHKEMERERGVAPLQTPKGRDAAEIIRAKVKQEIKSRKR